MRIVYFVHNLHDPAVAKRLMMLKAAGAQAKVIGFWRGPAAPPAEIAGAPVLALGCTYDARLAHRAMVSLKHALLPGAIVDWMGKTDLLIARNLEMLAIAAGVRRRAVGPLALVYEVLDIHRLLLRPGAAGRCLRSVERRLMDEARLLIVSSPAYLREYFELFGSSHPPVLLLENKALALHRAPEIPVGGNLAGPPWRIGWLGMIRCRRSLALLDRLAGRRPDLVQVQIFGRPTKEVEEDLQRQARHVRFGGAYRPQDLSTLYRQMHFNWAIDYYEEAGNSNWLLPNRIYEGGKYNVVPMAVEGTQTAHWLADLGLGVRFKDPALELEGFLGRLDPRTYQRYQQAACQAPRSAFLADQGDCDRLVGLLSRVVSGAALGANALCANRSRAPASATPMLGEG